MDALDLVRRTARLARLELGEEEVLLLAPELARILAAFETLSRFEPSAPLGPGAAPRGHTRGDVPQPSLPRERCLAAASETEDGFFVVPRTVGGEE